MERQVVHLNVAHFMAAVEELADSSLRGRPFVIAPPGKSRSVVLDASEAAFREGIRRGMPLEGTLRSHRGIIVVEPHFERYGRAEEKIYELSSRYSPAVEQNPGGHLFMDVTGTGRLFGHPLDLAARIRQEIYERIGLRPVTGLAVNKLVSKVATRVVRPYGFIAVPPGDERSFLRHQQVGILPGIGRRLSERMTLLGIAEAGELAELSDSDAAGALGKNGITLRERARGVDTAPVTGERASARKIKSEKIFDTDTNDRSWMESQLYTMAEDAGAKARRENLSAGRLELAIVYTDSYRQELRAAFPRPVYCDAEFFSAAKLLLERGLARRVRVRKLTLALAGLSPEFTQLDLFTPPEKIKRESLQRAIDGIRTRYGRESLRLGISLKTH